MKISMNVVLCCNIVVVKVGNMFFDLKDWKGWNVIFIFFGFFSIYVEQGFGFLELCCWWELLDLRVFGIIYFFN